MRTERLASLFVFVGLVTVVVLSPVSLPQGWDKPAHFAVFSLLTAALWHATGGRNLVLILGAVVALAGIDEWRQAYLPGRNPDATDFLTDLCAAATTAALLVMQRKPTCVESSPR